MEPGKYQISASVKGDKLDKVSLWLWATFEDGTKKVFAKNFKADKLTAGKWNQLMYDFTLPQKAKKLLVLISLWAKTEGQVGFIAKPKLEQLKTLQPESVRK